MKKGETKTGFNYEIDKDAMDDIEMVEDLAEIDKGNLLKLPGVVENLLGKSQKKALYDHVRRAGRVKVSDVLAEVEEMLNSLGDEEKK